MKTFFIASPVINLLQTGKRQLTVLLILFSMLLFCLFSNTIAAHGLKTEVNGISKFNTAAPGNLATSPTLTFTGNTGFADNTISDGDGGSVPISDIDLQIYAINSSGTKLTSDLLEYHAADWGYPGIITYSTGSGYYGWTIKSSTGNNFSLQKINFFDFGGWDGATFVAQAFDNGVSLGTVTFSGNTVASYVSLLSGGVLTSVFGSIDEVRIYKQGGADSWIGLNTIKVTTPASTLPVSFTSFTASLNNKQASLQWQTSGEINAMDFTVQHSTDGNRWNSLSILPAAGNSSNLQNYQYTHAEPLRGNNYYRILQTDLNGHTDYSEIRTVKVTDNHAVFSVVSNPVQNGILKLQVYTGTVVNLFNTDGKLVMKKQLTPGLQIIEVSNLNAGIYYLSGSNTMQKIIIQ